MLEPAGPAALKLGNINQWLNVMDITGQAGYVAAWYATAVDNPAIGVKTPTPESGPVTATTDLVVRTTADQVALRQTPVVSETTSSSTYRSGPNCWCSKQAAWPRWGSRTSG